MNGRMGKSLAFLVCVLAVVGGCEDSQSDNLPPAAVLYCSVDETFAKQIITRYEQQTGRRVELITDSEAGKTTGLIKKLRLEKGRPRADVFWSSEQSQTILLARDGMFTPYDSPSAEDIPDEFKNSKHLWTGFALRARVVAYDPKTMQVDRLPRTWAELAEPRYASNVAIANPLFGTTRGHMAAMYVLWGPQRFRDFLTRLVDGDAVVADSNSSTVRKLIAGEVKLALTDSDDVLTANAHGHDLKMIFPDMGDGGTMLIPNTVALVAGCAHPKEAKQLIDYILSSEVEESLAKSASGNYPARTALRKKLGMKLPQASKVNEDQIADLMGPAINACREILLK